MCVCVCVCFGFRDCTYCCSELQCVEVCCSAVQCFGFRDWVQGLGFMVYVKCKSSDMRLKRIFVGGCFEGKQCVCACEIAHSVAVCCSVLQCVQVCCSVVQCFGFRDWV